MTRVYGRKGKNDSSHPTSQSLWPMRVGVPNSRQTLQRVLGNQREREVDDFIVGLRFTTRGFSGEVVNLEGMYHRYPLYGSQLEIPPNSSQDLPNPDLVLTEKCGSSGDWVELFDRPLNDLRGLSYVNLLVGPS